MKKNNEYANRINIKQLKWIKRTIEEANKENLLTFFVKGDEDNITCYLYHKGNGFLLKALYFKRGENK